MRPILVIGETCHDIHVTCSITRLCPEAPVPVLVPLSRTQTLGMAGNVTANIRSLGGRDVLVTHYSAPILKTRYVDQQTGYIVMRVDENDVVTDQFDLTLIPRFEGSAAIVISDYDKGYLSELAIQSIAEWAKEAGIPTLLDTKKLLGDWSHDITFVKVNQREDKANLAAGILPTQHCQNLIITLGPKGSVWVNRDITVPVEPIDVADLSGCGDTYMAAFVVKWLANGNNVITAMEWANRAARVAASKRGIVAVKWEEVE